MSRASPEPVTIAVLTKAPTPGLAKTRVAPVLGADGAAALQAKLTARAVATACSADVGPVCLWTSPDPAHPSFQALARTHALRLARQPDADLGLRMQTAVEAAGGPCLVIGTDCPALDTAHLRCSAKQLARGIDVVLIAAEDGGYVLIGMRKPQPALFVDMPWGTDSVAAETRRRMARMGLSWREPARLWDLDRPEDLVRLRQAGLGELLFDASSSPLRPASRSISRRLQSSSPIISRSFSSSDSRS